MPLFVVDFLNFSCEEKFISSCKGTQNIDKEQCKKGCNLIKPHHFSTQNGKMQNISRISSFCIRLHSLVYQFIKLNSAKNKLLFTREVHFCTTVYLFSCCLYKDFAETISHNFIRSIVFHCYGPYFGFYPHKNSSQTSAFLNFSS